MSNAQRYIVPQRRQYGPSALSVNGPDAVKAATKLRGANDRKDQWPYWWTYPPPNAKDVMPSGSIPAPQVGQQAQILQYTVPQGMRFVLAGIIQQFYGNGLVEGSGAAIWTLDRDTPTGNNIVQGFPVAWFNQLSFTLGNLDNGPFKLAAPEIFEAGAVLRSKVITTSSITPGAPNYFLTILWGWAIPAE